MTELLDTEWLLLDGQCRPEVQIMVDAARERLVMRGRYANMEPALAGFIADVIREAQQEGQLIYQHRRITFCPLCKRAAAYPVYKSGRKKGQPNYSKPRLGFAGIELAYRFVRIEGHVALGGCADCINGVEPWLREELRGVPTQLTESLKADGEPQRIRYKRKRCKLCGWEGHEGEMRQLPAIMGSSYPGGCPNCPAETGLFRNDIEHCEGFVVEELEATP